MTERRRRWLKRAGVLVAIPLVAHGLFVLGAEGDAIDAWPATVGDFRTVPQDFPLRGDNAQAATLGDLALGLGIELRQRRVRGAPSVDEFLVPLGRWRRDPSSEFPPACDDWLRDHEALLDATTTVLLNDPPPRWASGFGTDGHDAPALPVSGIERLGRVLFCRAERDAAAGRHDRARAGAAALLRLSALLRGRADGSLVLAVSQARRALVVLRELPCVTPDDVDALRLPSARDLEEEWRVEAFQAWGTPRERLALLQDDMGTPPLLRGAALVARPVMRWDMARLVESRGRVLTALSSALPDAPGVAEIAFAEGGSVTQQLLHGGCGCGFGGHGETAAETWARVAWDLPASRALTRRVAELRGMRFAGALPPKGRIAGAAAGLPSETWALAHEVAPDGRLRVSLVAARPWQPEVMEWREQRATSP